MIESEHFFNNARETVNHHILTLISDDMPPALYEAMRYSLENGGKRIRPLLTLATGYVFGKDIAEIILPACAVEMIHTYSLIHDDLPAMDNSDYRRGKPSCHVKFGEALAILTGDALLTIAFDVVRDYGVKHDNEKKALQICHLLSLAAGPQGMVGGQVLDLEAEGISLRQADIEKIAALKTGKIISASVIIGAIAGGASEEEIAVLEQFANKIGLAFQIVDDLFDYEDSNIDIGKPVGIDQAAVKATIPGLIGTAQARKYVEMLFQDALSFLDELDRPVQLLSDLASKMVYRKK